VRRVALAVSILAATVASFADASDARTVHGCALKHHATCAGVDLSGQDLRGAVLHHADLRGANLERADLRGVVLHHANLRGANLRGAKLHHLPSHGADVRMGAACSPNCQGADLSYADLSDAELAGADLRYANLTGANLTGAELRSANLAYIVLTAAVLTAADATGAVNCATAVPAGVLDGEGCADDPATDCYATSPYSASTGTFIVTGNTFNQTSTYAIPDNDTQITSLTVNATVGATGVYIASSARNFTASFSGASTGTFSETLSGLQAPWTTNTGPTVRSLAWNVADTGYGVAGTGRIRVRGAGTISTWSTNPDQRIRVTVTITGTTRVAVSCS
jgi:hypothetical protein